MSEEIDTARILSLEIGGENDSGEPTVRGYLVALLRTLWHEGEGFSGKRPFGNSSWEYDLYVPLIKAGLIRGKLDEDGYIDGVDDKAGDKLIAAAIETLAAPPPAGRDALEQLAAPEVDMHRWHAVIRHGGEIVTVIGHTGDGLRRFASVDEWDASQ